MRDGWSIEALDQVCVVEYGSRVVRKKDGGTIYPVYGGGRDTFRMDIFNRENCVIVSRFGVSERCVRYVSGKFFLNDSGLTVATGDQTKLLQRFLDYQLFSLNAPIYGLCRGTAQKNLDVDAFRNLNIAIPKSLTEQQRVVAILDEAFAGLETATANAERNILNARELFGSILANDIFGDPDQQNWELTTVAEIALQRKGSIRTGPFGSQLLHGEFVDEGIAVLGIDNVVANEFRWGKSRFITPTKFSQLSRYQVLAGDVLITIMGTCGRCAVVPDDIPVAINTKHLCCISLDPNRCLPNFLHAYFLYHPIARTFLQKQAKGSIMDGLNMGIVQRLPVRLPSITTQQTIIEALKSLSLEIRKLETVYRQKLDAIAGLKQSLLQSAFSGELTSPPSSAIKEAAE